MTDAHEWLHAAPAHWTRGRLKNLTASATNGAWGSDPVGDGDDVHCIRAADFDRTSRRALLAHAPLRHVDASSLRQHLLRPGDLILEKSGGGEKQPVGMAVLFTDAVKAVCSNFCARVKPSKNVEPRFLSYVFAAAYEQGLTQAAIKQTTGIQNLDTEAFFSSPWVYPPEEEQRSIADFLDAETSKLKALDDRFKKLTGLLEERKAALIAACFAFNGADGVQVLPLRRAVKRWIDYRGATPEKTESGVTLVTAKNIRNGHIDLEVSREFIATDAYADWMRRGLLEVNDVLLTTEAPLGQVAMVNDTFIALAQRVILLRAKQDVCSPEWLYWYLLSPQGQAELELRSTGSTALGIKADRLRGVPIPLPTLSEATQRLGRLAERVTQIEALRRKLAEQRTLVAERRQALITAAVTGQFDVSTASGRNVAKGVTV
ncbi:restriction endonuclease subunit S [Streptomyces sp. NPDC013953]|uniref:restriction endonuclease subunit S n=1 Tax=Streptomyces sp. NPDC013953 TaxID=3364868 RepID=UPI003701C5F8